MFAPLPENESQRLEALHRYFILDTPREDEYDDITHLAASLCDTSFAGIVFLDAERQWFKSSFGYSLRETSREIAICAYTILETSLLIIQDTLEDVRFSDNPIVTGEPFIRFYAGAPLVTPDGFILGSLCVTDTKPRTLTPDQQDALRVLARQTMTHLELARCVALHNEIVKERQLALEEARQSEERLSQSQRFSHIGSWEYDLGTEQVYWSEEMFRLLERDSASGAPALAELEAMCLADDLALARQILWKARPGDPLCEFKIRVLTPAGSFRWLQSHGRCVYDSAGQLIRIIGMSTDITDQLSIEAEHQRTGDSLRQLVAAFDNAAEGITVADRTLPDSPLIYCNAAFLEMTGYAAHEVLGRNCRFLQGADTEPEAVRQMREAIAASKSCRVTLQNYRKDGTKFWNELSLAPVLDHAGNLSHYVGIQQDVTAMKQVQEALEASRREVTDILESITDAFVALDRSWRYTYINDQAERVLRRRREELLGKIIWEEIPEIVGTTFEREYRRAAAEKVTVNFEAYRPDLNIWLEAHIYPSDGGISIYLKDITIRKSAEEDRDRALEVLQESEMSLRLALKSGHFGSYIRDAVSGRFLSISDICKVHLGFSPDSEITFADVMQARHPEDRHWVDEVTTKAKENHHDYIIEHRVISLDGTIHWIAFQGGPVYNESGELVKIAGITQDITERKQMEADREIALREAQERADRDGLTNLLNHRAFQSQLLEETSRALRIGATLAVAMLDLDDFNFFNKVYGHFAGDSVLRLIAARLRSLSQPGDVLARFGGDEFAMLFPNVGRAHVGEIESRLRRDLSGLSFRPVDQDVTIPLSLSLGVALYPHGDVSRHDVLHRAEERLRWSKTGGEVEAEAQRIRAYAQHRVQGFSMMDALVTAVDNKDRYTRKHSEDVMSYSLTISEELGFSESEKQIVAISALLHDVGKIGVPDSVLRKPGKLTEAEYDAIKQHPMMGAIMVSAVPGLEGTLDAVRHHHERWDGEGYPFGLRGEETPLIARLMAVADAFSAMTTDRPYRQGMQPDKALLILAAGAGTQWDVECVQAFMRGLDLG